MSRRSTIAAIVAVYVALTLVYTWPLASRLASGVAHDPWDPILNTWILWWSGTQAVPLTRVWWNAPAFFPAAGVLAFSEHLLGLAPLTSPIIALTHSPLAAYNTALIATFIFSALGAHFLAFTITRRHDAAFIAALAYAFAPYRVAQLPHIQVLASYGAPACLAALHRFGESSRPKWAVLAAVAWLVQALSCGYYLLSLSVLIALWALWFAAGRWTLRQGAIAAAPFVAAALLVAPLLFGYRHILSDTYGFSRGLEEIQNFSADVAAFLHASEDLLLWGWLHVVRQPESEIFPGLTIVLLTAWALADARPFAAESDTRATRGIRWALAALAALLLAAAVVPVVYGSWRLAIGGVRLISIARPDKPLALALFAALAWSATLPRVSRAIRRRSPLVFYTFAAFAMWVFALGPDPLIFGRRLLYQAPYGWLMRLPGFDGLRVPARFWMMAIVCLSVLGALAINRLNGRARRVVVALAAAGILLDGWPRQFSVVAAPPLRPSPANVTTRLDLPSNDDRDPFALYEQMFDRVPIYNGYSGYTAPHMYAMREMLNAHDTRILSALTRRGPMGVVIDRASDPDASMRRFVAAFPGATLTHDEAAWSSYRLPATDAPAPPEVSGSPLAIKTLDAIPSAPHAARATDGSFNTRWSGGVQRSFAEFTIELERPSRVSQVVVDLGEFMTDFPQKLRIDISPDGRAWETVFLGDTVLQAYYGAVRHPREIPLVFLVNREGVRFVRLQQNGWGTHDWSIAEISVRQ